MKTEIRIDIHNCKRRVMILQEGDFRTLKHEFLGRKLAITIWLEAAVFQGGDIVVTHRTQDEPNLVGRFELLEEIDQKGLKRNGVQNYYQKWTAVKFTGRLGRGSHGG